MSADRFRLTLCLLIATAIGLGFYLLMQPRYQVYMDAGGKVALFDNKTFQVRTWTGNQQGAQLVVLDLQEGAAVAIPMDVIRMTREEWDRAKRP